MSCPPWLLHDLILLDSSAAHFKNNQNFKLFLLLVKGRIEKGEPTNSPPPDFWPLLWTILVSLNRVLFPKNGVKKIAQIYTKLDLKTISENIFFLVKQQKWVKFYLRKFVLLERIFFFSSLPSLSTPSKILR